MDDYKKGSSKMATRHCGQQRIYISKQEGCNENFHMANRKKNTCSKILSVANNIFRRKLLHLNLDLSAVQR